MKHIARSTLIVSVFFGLDKILGFGRLILVNRQFGLSYEMDVFNAANNIPDLLSALISGGALGVALIPVLSEYLEERGRPAAWNLFSRIVNLAFLVTAGLSLLIIVFAKPLVSFKFGIAPGFPPAQQDLTAELMQLDLVAIIIFSISGLVMAGLQANQHFLLPAMAPGLYNLGQIFGLIILAPLKGLTLGGFTLPAFGLGIHGLVYGVILGSLFHVGIQIPGLIKYRFHWTPAINLGDPGVKQVLKLLGPRVITMFFLYMFFYVRDNLASGLGEGAVSALNNGWLIMQLPETLIGTAIGITLLPTLSEQFARGETEAFRHTLNHALRTILALTIPAATLMAVALPPFIEVVFGFDPLETSMVVWASRAYLLGLIGHSMLEVAARSFYAHQDALTPLYAAALNALAYIFLAVSLSRSMGHTGIALANSIVFTSEALLLLYLLHRRLPGLLQLGSTLRRVVLVSVVGGLVVFSLMRLPFIPSLPLTAGSLTLVGVLLLPFIWPEVNLLLKM